MKILSLLLFSCMAFGMYAAVSLNPVDYADGNQKLHGFAGIPEKTAYSGKKAGVLILPAWMGIDDHSKEVARKLTDMGYHTFVADIYGEGNYPKNMQEAGAKSGSFKNDRVLYRKRIQLALDELVRSGADKDQLVIIGYCFGGTGALEAARANMPVKAVVSFHGGLSANNQDKTAAHIEPKVLICHGADDPYESLDEQLAIQRELKDADADWQMIYYSGAVHAFTDPHAGNDNSKGAAYNQKADKRSWEDMLQLFEEVFGS